MKRRPFSALQKASFKKPASRWPQVQARKANLKAKKAAEASKVQVLSVGVDANFVTKMTKALNK